MPPPHGKRPPATLTQAGGRTASTGPYADRVEPRNIALAAGIALILATGITIAVVRQNNADNDLERRRESYTSMLRENNDPAVSLADKADEYLRTTTTKGR